MAWYEGAGRRTVDGNSHALGEHIAVSALESRDLAEFVEEAVVVAHALCGLGVDLLKLETVGLGDGEDGGGARVVLEDCTVSVRSFQAAAATRLPCLVVGGGSGGVAAWMGNILGRSRSCQRVPWLR